jgi:hypothetical protein
VDVFDLRQRLVDDYANFTRSFIVIRDDRIRERVDHQLEAGLLWPHPIVQLNPAFEPGGTIDDLVADGVLHEHCRQIFRRGKTPADPSGQQLRLHRHQREAIKAARRGGNYVLTTGTGSGKSLAYIVPIIDHVLRNGSGRGIQALVVYPMNALANSQLGELEKFLSIGPALTSYPDHPGMLLARGFSELADDRGDLAELVSALEASLSSAAGRYGSSKEEIEELVEWLLDECTRRRQPRPRAW